MVGQDVVSHVVGVKGHVTPFASGVSESQVEVLVKDMCSHFNEVGEGLIALITENFVFVAKEIVILKRGFSVKSCLAVFALKSFWVDEIWVRVKIGSMICIPVFPMKNFVTFHASIPLIGVVFF